MGSKRLAYVAVIMRLLVESEIKPAGGIVCAGFDDFRWPRPLRPGTSCTERSTRRAAVNVAADRLINVRTTTLIQNDHEDEQVQIDNVIVPPRQSGKLG
jgi:acyl dehydratase